MLQVCEGILPDESNTEVECANFDEGTDVNFTLLINNIVNSELFLMQVNLRVYGEVTTAERLLISEDGPSASVKR